MADNTTFTPLKGHCTCQTITYEVTAPFLCTNCCHCTWCQRETGSAFVINSIVESYYFRITSETRPVITKIPSASGDGQMMARCPKCSIVVYSDYGEYGTWMVFVKAATLDDEGKKRVKPDVHIYTSTKMDWVDLTSEKERGVPIFEEGFKFRQVWRKEAVERLDVLKQKQKGMKMAQDARDEIDQQKEGSKI